VCGKLISAASMNKKGAVNESVISSIADRRACHLLVPTVQKDRVSR
jgi:hypothetical protein